MPTGVVRRWTGSLAACLILFGFGIMSAGSSTAAGGASATISDVQASDTRIRFGVCLDALDQFPAHVEASYTVKRLGVIVTQGAWLPTASYVDVTALACPTAWHTFLARNLAPGTEYTLHATVTITPKVADGGVYLDDATRAPSSSEDTAIVTTTGGEPIVEPGPDPAPTDPRPSAAATGEPTPISTSPSPTDENAPASPAPKQCDVVPTRLTDPQAFTAAQLAALSAAQVGGIEPRQLAQIRPSVLARLTASQATCLGSQALQGLTKSAMHNLSPRTLAALPINALKALRVPQIRALSRAQAAAITPAQRAALTPAQRAALRAVGSR